MAARDGVPIASGARKRSLRLSPLSVDCPTQRCGAKPGEWCARLAGGVGNGFDWHDLNIHGVRVSEWLKRVNGGGDEQG